MSDPSTPSPAIRALAAADLPAALALWRESDGLGHGPGDTVPALERFLARNPDLSACAVDPDGAIVAALLCGHDGRRGFLYRLAVRPDRRRGGLARALVARSLAGLRTEGIERCQVFVLRGSAPAEGLWTALGAERRDDLGVFSLRV